MRITSAGPFAAAPSAGSPAANAWITNFTRCRTHLGQRLAAVQLRPAESGVVDDLDQALRPLVPEDADGHGLRREPLDDVAHGIGANQPAAARSQHEADRVSSHRHCEERVLLARDATDLHEHPELNGTGPTGPAGCFVKGDITMTRKHFAALAEALRDRQPHYAPTESRTEYGVRYCQWEADVRGIAAACARLNPGFKRERFYDACGLEG